MKALLPAILILMLGTAVSAGYDEAWIAYSNQDYETALKELMPLAEQGDPRSQYVVGWMYRNGEGVAQDYKTAVKWYRLAAKQGHAEAQKSLGLMYQFGEGITANYQSASKWYRLAAEQGNAEAQNNLGLMYFQHELFQSAFRVAKLGQRWTEVHVACLRCRALDWAMQPLFRSE